jgi:hypothetical protein
MKFNISGRVRKARFYCTGVNSRFFDLSRYPVDTGNLGPNDMLN